MIGAIRRWLEARRMRQLLGQMDGLLYGLLIVECDELLRLLRSL